MTPRLTRAMQRGGVAAQVRDDVWGVWRSRDRRGRMIGTVSGADIDLLRLRNCLKPLGDQRPPILIWAGPTNAIESVDPTVAKNLTRPIRSMLDILLRDRVSPAQRNLIRQACQVYLSDLEQVASGGTHVTMNWDRLSQVDKSTRGDHVPGGVMSRQRQLAQRRLGVLANTLSDPNLRFLEALVMREATRSELSRISELRPALADQRGLTVLRALLDAYKSELKPLS